MDLTQPLAELADSITEVPLVSGELTRFVNFDYAASAPPLASVHATVSTALAHYASIHRGQSYLSRASTVAYEQARATVGSRLGARADDVVIFTRNTTDALNLLASAIPATASGAGTVLHLDIEHHANLLPWRGGSYRSVAAGPSVEATLAIIEAELQREPVALFAITGASNVTGEITPIASFAELAHRYGARIVVDGAQLAPHRPVDIAATEVDYFACSGHKLYAPYGGGVLVGRRDWLDDALPHQLGGGAVVNVGLDEVVWKPSPDRHEGGTPNLVGAVSIGSAFLALESIGYEQIVAHESALYRQLVGGLEALGISVLRLWPEHQDLVGVASFNVPGWDPGLVACYLSSEYGIGVRGGRFCAHPLLERFGLGCGGAVRASIGLGTTSEDVELLLSAITRLINVGPGWRYVECSGYWCPDPDPRPMPDHTLGFSLVL